MPSSRTITGEEPSTITVPVGSERVVNVRRLNKESEDGEPMAPLSVNTSYPSHIDLAEMEMQEQEMVIRRKQKTEHRHKSHGSRTNEKHLTDSGVARTGRAWSTVYPDHELERGKVISYLEMDIGKTNRSHRSIPARYEGELGSNVSTNRESKSHRKSQRSHKERQSWLSMKTESTEANKWRHSNIFAPEEVRVRSSHHKVRRPRSITVQPSSTTSMWSPFIPVPVSYFPQMPYHSCPKCGEAAAPPLRSYSYDVLRQPTYNPYEVPMYSYPPYSAENVFLPNQASSHAHYHQHLKMNRSRTVPPSTSSIHNHGLHHTARQPSLGVLLSNGSEEAGALESDQAERVVMEIEYAEATDAENNMSPETLKLIVRLAKQVRKLNDLEEMARQLKIDLDKQLGERWQVVIGDDSFGSYLASLPGALANFRINRDVFLVWQT